MFEVGKWYKLSEECLRTKAFKAGIVDEMKPLLTGKSFKCEGWDIVGVNHINVKLSGIKGTWTYHVGELVEDYAGVPSTATGNVAYGLLESRLIQFFVKGETYRVDYFSGEDRLFRFDKFEDNMFYFVHSGTEPLWKYTLDFVKNGEINITRVSSFGGNSTREIINSMTALQNVDCYEDLGREYTTQSNNQTPISTGTAHTVTTHLYIPPPFNLEGSPVSTKKSLFAKVKDFISPPKIKGTATIIQPNLAPLLKGN